MGVNNTMSDKDFVTGMFPKESHQNAPDFIKGTISINRADFGNWLRARPEQWLNIDIKESKGGKLYAEVNSFVPDKSKAAPAKESAQSAKPDYPEPDLDDDIPF